VSNSADFVSLSSVPDGSEVHLVSSADLLGIGPVSLVVEVSEDGLGGVSLADELSLSIAVSVGPFTLGVRFSAVFVGVVLGFTARCPEVATSREAPVAFFLEVISTSPEVLAGLSSSNSHDSSPLMSVSGVNEVTTPSDTELSGLSPGSSEVVESKLEASSLEDVRVHPCLVLSLSSKFSLANVSLSGTAVSVVPFATGVVDVHLSAASLL